MIRQIILVTLSSFIICVDEINGQDDEKVRCEASALRMGGKGEITCLFPKDLNQQNAMNIIIRQFGTDMSEATVLECLWDKKLYCPKRRSGYITEVTGRTLKVKIPIVTEAHLGRYRCTMMDTNNPIHGDDCPFLINGDERVGCEASAAYMGGEGEITCLFPKDLDQAQSPALVTVKQYIGALDQHVLTCLWDDIHQCNDVRPGYSLGNATGRSLQIKIPNVIQAHLGNYRCTLMVATGLIDAKPCSLLIKSAVRPTPLPALIDRDRGDGDHDQTTRHDNGSSSSPHVGVIVGSVFAALVVVILVIFVFVWYRRNRRRKRCQKDLRVSAKGETDEEQQKSFLHDGQWHDPNDRDGTPVLISNGMQENTGDMQGNNEQNETLDQQEGSPAADRSAVLPAIHSTTDSDVEVAEEASEDLAPAPSAADMSGDVSGKPEDKTATTGEEGMLKYIYSRGWESVVNLGSKAIQYGKSLTPLYGGDNTKAKVPTDSRADTNSHLESSTDVPSVASDTPQSGTGGPDDEGSTADGTEEETSDTGKDEAALTEPITPEDKGAEAREETIPSEQSYRGGSNRPTTGGEGTGRGAARSSGQRSPRHGDDGIKPSLTTGADTSTSPLLGDGITSDPHHSTKRGTEEKGEKSVGELTSMFEQRRQQDSTATASRQTR